mmetsp:Transcript_2617/g.3571  ORF Transcript_2617/g.3571 Transcript_2617/m.3571 type:complete len:445 (+) Transcript_2617:163-1497(+)|eukprot:CAMPEP_0170081742 /NCGR_PEP_ID=MMETSP0019_2-20121128/17524_1 /TAXON_ID=98059 /ORGANISM="Dinobryon sp., Strain UTEXLB2267" /LENGTH=444 /DNA_ID=CAMNT_0010296305 /DNA_START=168 /DNA_END=1502 /DNA_ORIENTATION=-
MSRKSFVIKQGYDYSKSSEENYSSIDSDFVGEYKNQREQLDYSYHTRYSEERQYLQDSLINEFPKTRVQDRDGITICEKPLENWIVFTAGPMGAGKNHTMKWLNDSGLFPLDAFVNVDPDAIRDKLPEIEGYNQRNPATMGFLTQKEVGYITETLTFKSLSEGRNVLVCGSLRDANWYQEYFKQLRKKFPVLKIAIINVSTKIETALQRAAQRALVTHRIVPDSVIIEGMLKTEKALKLLMPHTNFVATIDNDRDIPTPRLRFCVMRDQSCEQLLWAITLQDNHSSLSYHNSSMLTDSSSSTSLDAFYLYSKGNNNYNHKKKDPNNDHTPVDMNGSIKSTNDENNHHHHHHKNNGESCDEVKHNLPEQECEGKLVIKVDYGSDTKVVSTIDTSMTTPQYIYTDYQSRFEKILNDQDWEFHFKEVWTMQCGMHSSNNSPILRVIK